MKKEQVGRKREEDEDSEQSMDDNDGDDVVVVQLAKLERAPEQKVFYQYVVDHINNCNKLGQWVKASGLYREGDRQRTANWFAKDCKEKLGDHLLIKKEDNAYSFKKE
jgi:hypothetical protein